MATSRTSGIPAAGVRAARDVPGAQPADERLGRAPEARAPEARAPEARAAGARADLPPESLAARYSRLAGERFEPRSVDALLRGLDIAIAGSALVTASPLIATIAIAVRAGSGTPVLYRGDRVGRAGVVFTMYKFRTLAPDAETRLGPFSGAELSRRTEDEVTPVGHILRATQLDEIPQLWNVLRGDMSIVGPRPIRPAFFEELCDQIPQYWQRLVVRPGLTGFAQMRVTRNHSWAEKLAHDLEYIADRSAALYGRVIAETAWRVLRRTAASLAGRPPPPAPG
jgi:lipopolysaccharide/colanic/teichoic acid biosynthesis glycosyltransferase